MPGALLLMLAAAMPLPADAAGQLPPWLAGSWGTAESLHAGSTGQTELYLEADGFGVMGASSAPARRLGGAEAGKPDARAIIGLPVRATFDGSTLVIRPFLPPGRQAGQDIVCRYDAAGPSLACVDVEGSMRRRSDTVPAEAGAIIEALRRPPAPKQPLNQ